MSFVIENEVSQDDSMLSGAAIHALVELDERSTLSMVEKRFSKSRNPYELIEGARALSLWGNQQYYKVLLGKYLKPTPNTDAVRMHSSYKWFPLVKPIKGRSVRSMSQNRR